MMKKSLDDLLEPEDVKIDGQVLIEGGGEYRLQDTLSNAISILSELQTHVGTVDNLQWRSVRKGMLKSYCKDLVKGLTGLDVNLSRMNVVWAGELIPEDTRNSIFLAGPTPRSSDVQSWRKEALELLDALDYDGTVFVPEPRDFGKWLDERAYCQQCIWETEALHLAGAIVFWIPRDLEILPGFTTNVEFGEWYRDEKSFFGAPNGAHKMKYLEWKAAQHGKTFERTLIATLTHTMTWLENDINESEA